MSVWIILAATHESDRRNMCALDEQLSTLQFQELG